MKNYNEIIKNSTNIEEVKKAVTDFNNDLADNVDCKLDENKLKLALDFINKQYEKAFSNAFCSLLDTDRKTAYLDLIANPSFKKFVCKIAENGTITIEEKKAVFKFATLEKQYQLNHSIENDNDGKPILNKKVSVFGAKRFYGLCESFIRNMLISNITVDEEKVVNLSRVKIADKTIFNENDGKAFSSNSNNALEKQLNILVKFFDIDVKMLKKDLPILKLSAQRVKKDTCNKSSIKETNVLKFADTLFSVVTSRYSNENTKVITNDKTK